MKKQSKVDVKLEAAVRQKLLKFRQSAAGDESSELIKAISQLEL